MRRVVASTLKLYIKNLASLVRLHNRYLDIRVLQVPAVAYLHDDQTARMLILSPNTRRDQDTQVEISKQTLSQLYSFGDRSKSIKLLWQFI